MRKNYKRYKGRSLHKVTPAYAGKSELEVLAICGAEDHPRIRGEK